MEISGCIFSRLMFYAVWRKTKEKTGGEQGACSAKTEPAVHEVFTLSFPFSHAACRRRYSVSDKLWFLEILCFAKARVSSVCAGGRRHDSHSLAVY